MLNSILVIRDRYQITIPDKVRDQLAWVVPSQVVKISTSPSNKIIIEPYENMQHADWNMIWRVIHKTKKDKKTNSLTQFIVNDRETRR
jgi:bifunctional DNA-binding transcriptional regulator/antitoxin component of YhaV-PrlF toxin-antitoxin module